MNQPEKPSDAPSGSLVPPVGQVRIRRTDPTIQAQCMGQTSRRDPAHQKALGDARAVKPSGAGKAHSHHAMPLHPNPPAPAVRAALTPAPAGTVTAELIAVIVAVTDGDPRVLTVEDAAALPSGPFEPGQHSLQAGLRTWVERQTHHPLGHCSSNSTPLPTRGSSTQDPALQSDLDLVSRADARGTPSGESGVGWQSWYRYFPWEDQRAPDAAATAEALTRALQAWADATPDAALRHDRQRLIATNPGGPTHPWNEELGAATV